MLLNIINLIRYDYNLIIYQPANFPCLIFLFCLFEDIYRKEGWHVSYDKPVYDENYPSTFEFKIGKK